MKYNICVSINGEKCPFMKSVLLNGEAKYIYNLCSLYEIQYMCIIKWGKCPFMKSVLLNGKKCPELNGT
jgi:hypothetical protein